MGLELVEVHFLDTFPQVVNNTSVLTELISLQSLKANYGYLRQIITFKPYGALYSTGTFSLGY